MIFVRLFLFLGLIGTLGCSNGASFGVEDKQEDFSSTLYNNKVDIIWVIDDSLSMNIPQQKLAAQVDSMIQTLNSLKMDYRMVVTTTSIGNGFAGGTYFGSPQILTASTPNLVSIFQNRLLRGESGSNLEQGLLSVQNLLSPNFLSQGGQGFHREEALLLINFLSDEDDQSPGSASSVVQSLTNQLNTFKRPFRPNVGGWLVNFIGVLDTTCQNNFGQSWIGNRYIDLVNISKGTKYSICTPDLSLAVKGLQTRVLEIITDYPLSSVPNLATLRVLKDGLVVPRSQVNGWDYIPDLRVIRFFGTAVPAVDSKIRVEFTPDSAG